MAVTNRIRIIVYDQQLDYKSAEDLGIKFNRIVDDLSNLSNKFGDFSYNFSLPRTKNNNKIFQYADAHGRKNIFKPNRDLPCRVYNNDRLLLDGVISLEAITNDSYTCTFYSKLKEFADLIEDKTLKDLVFDTVSWDYEDTIINHINANYADSDTALYQFPFIYYGTIFTPTPTYNSKTDFKGSSFDQDTYPRQQYYYAMNTVYPNTDNRYYGHQYPPAFYIVRVMEQIFTDAGWSIGGQWINNPNIKKIVMTYAGDNDIYDQATGEVSGSDPVTMQPAKLLPEMEQSKFLNGIINMFNLYFKIDIANKIIKFETYQTLFTDTYNPYDITDKVFKETVVMSYNENNDPSITFDTPENVGVMGDNMTMVGATTDSDSIVWKKTSGQNFSRFFNKEGTTEEIELPFSAPTIKRTYMWNDDNDSGTNTSAGSHIIFQPLMSEQTPLDNDSHKFCKNTGHTYLYNTEDTIKHGGAPMLMYYYGQSASDIVQKTGKGAQSAYFYQSIPSNTGSTLNRVSMGFCSPFQLKTFREEIDTYLDSGDSADSRLKITASYLQTIWNMMSTQAGTVPSTTDFSLVFDDNGYMHESLWTKFHQAKYMRYQTAEMLEADMRMNDYDWNKMQIDQPISYNKEYYHLVAIQGYDPIKRTATIRLIKKV